jgi:hypothetical protein
MSTGMTSTGMTIVVLDRGWVYVGRCRQEGTNLIIEDAKNIRRWGTTQGLGQLALEGAQPNTILDPVGTVIAPMRAVIHQIVCKVPL